MTSTLGWPIPPKPASFTPEGAPAGVEIKFVSFWQQRALFAEPPRSLLAHTNGAENEGSIESASNWAEAKPNSNTAPHYQVGRTHGGVARARKMLPTNRVGIANATVMPGSSRWPTLTAAQQAEILRHGQIRLWSLAIETADLGWPTANRPNAPGGTVGFDEGQGELLATIIAYEANVSPNLPLVQLAEWWGAGIGAHTDPDGYPFTTTAPGKPCPGDAKKRDMRDWILPRAVEIYLAWAGRPVVVPPVTPTFPPTSEEDDMIIVDYGRQGGVDWWWTRCVIAGGTIVWVQGKAQEWTDPLTGQVHKLDELTSKRIQVENDQHFADLLATYKATSACPSTFALNAALTAAWTASKAR